MGKKKTHEEYEEQVKILHNGSISVLSRYQGVKTHISLKCKTCNHEWSTNPHYVVAKGREKGCPQCSKIKIVNANKRKGELRNEKAKNTFLNKFSKVHSDLYELVDFSEYKNNKTEMSVICRKHGLFKCQAANLLTGTGCKKCATEYVANKRRKTSDHFSSQIKSLGEGEYELISGYQQASTKVVIKHLSCGLEYEVIPNAFLQGRRCPNCCSISKGEEFISKLLLTKKVEFKRQQSFTKLRWDFDVFKFFIEYDGQQHFQPVEYWGGEEYYNKLKANDQIKNQYCIDNNIPLIRIPYWEFNNIEYILNNVLQHYDLIPKESTYDDTWMKYLVDENWNPDSYLALHK